MNTALHTIQSVYAAFGQGNIPAIIERLDPDIQWEAWESNNAQTADVPWLRAGSGHAGALAFFETIGSFKFEQFQVIAMMANDQKVAVELVIDVVLPNGKRVRDEEMHLWDVNAAGRVTRFRHYVDTAKHIAASR